MAGYEHLLYVSCNPLALKSNLEAGDAIVKVPPHGEEDKKACASKLKIEYTVCEFQMFRVLRARGKGFHLLIAVKSEMMGYVLTFISCHCCPCVLHDFWKGLIEDSRLVSPGSLGPLSILSARWDGSVPQKEDCMNWKRRIWGKRGINLQRFLQWWLVYILSRSLLAEPGFKDGVLALRGWGCWRSAATWLVYFPCIFSDRGRLCETCQMKTDMFGVWILIQALHSGSDINNATPLSIRAEIMECEDLWCSWCLVKENLARPGPGAMQEVLDLGLFDQLLQWDCCVTRWSCLWGNPL